MVRAGGTVKIPYKLSRQALGVEEWGPGATFTPTSPGSGSAQAFSIFGYIPAIVGTQPTPGTYTDTVVITIDY